MMWTRSPKRLRWLRANSCSVSKGKARKTKWPRAPCRQIVLARSHSQGFKKEEATRNSGEVPQTGNRGSGKPGPLDTEKGQEWWKEKVREGLVRYCSSRPGERRLMRLTRSSSGQLKGEGQKNEKMEV